MERTVLVSAALALASALCTADGLACLFDVRDVCVLSRPGNIVMVIIASALLLPTTASLLVAWLDARSSNSSSGDGADETTRLLEAGSPGSNRTPARPRRVYTYLYAGHLLSAWGDRMWQFAVPILFMEIFVDTLLPSASFSLAMYATCMVVIPSVGRLIDRSNRWTAMKYAIVAENAMIVLSSALLVAILEVTNADGVHKPEWTWRLVLLFAATLVCGGAGQVLNDAQTIGLERDWVVVIAGGDSSKLAQLNTTMRRIDLACKILGPMAFGVIMDFAGDDPTTRATIGAATVGVWNVASTPLEFVMTADIYHLVPELATKETHGDADKHDASEGKEEVNATCGSHVINEAAHFARQWREYAKHPVFLLSLSFCSLYMTVLSGGALNMAYLKWRGVANSLLGSSQGAGAVSGLLGTLAFPYLRSWLGKLESVAVLSVWLFWLCLLPILLAYVFTGESALSDYLLLGCVVVSRMWLWATDLADTQIMQEWIEPHKRGAVNAMQTATSQFFYMLILVVGIVFSDPHEFEALVFFSIAAVFAAVVGTTAWNLKYGRNRNIYVRKPMSVNPESTDL